MTKPTPFTAVFEILFGAFLLVLGILKPGIIWNSSIVQSMAGLPGGQTTLTIIIIAAGVLMILYCLVKLVIGTPAPKPR